MVTDFPEPVVPATRQCGIFARLPKTDRPEIFRPRAMVRGFGEFWNFSSERRVARPTVDFDLFGISIPTNDLPGIGASMRIGCAAKASAKSFWYATRRESFTPSAGLSA